MKLKYKYQKELYCMMKNHDNFYIQSPRTCGKSTMQRLLICRIIENRLSSFDRSEFKITERNVYSHLELNPRVFVCSQKEYNDAVEDFVNYIKN